MNGAAGPADGDNSVDERVTRLEERLDRERKARRQAEMIAERGMRDLWEINLDLQRRVDERTAQVGRLLAGSERARSAWASVMSDQLDHVRTTLDGDGTVLDVLDVLDALAALSGRPFVSEPFSARPAGIAGDLLRRWQRPTARCGQLLTTDADRNDAEVCTRWDCVIALGEVALDSIAHACGAGVIALRFTVEGAQLVVAIDHPPLRSDDRRTMWSATELIADRIVADGGGTMTWDDDRLEARFGTTA